MEKKWCSSINYIGSIKKGIKWFDKTNQYIIYGDESKIPNGHKKCMAGITNCFIDSDGKMYICIPNWERDRRI